MVLGREDRNRRHTHHKSNAFMKKIFLIGLISASIFIVVPKAQAAVSFVAEAHKGGSGSSATTTSFTVSGTNPVIVISSNIDGLNNSTTQLTWTGAGTPVLIKSISNASIGTAAVWCIAAPAAGTYTAHATYSASTNFQLSASVFSGADQSNPCPSADAVASTTSVSGTSMTLTASNLVTGDVDYGNAGLWTSGDMNLGMLNNSVYIDTSHNSDVEIGYSTSTASVTAQWLSGAGSNKAFVAIHIQQPQGSSSSGLLMDQVVAGTERTTLTNGTTFTSNAVTTTSTNELILAIIGINPSLSSVTTNKTLTGGGLTWTLAARRNANDGTAEVWYAFATSTLSSVSLTGTVSTTGCNGNNCAGVISIITFTGANQATPIGATSTNGSSSGTPTSTLTTTQAGSWVLGSLFNWSNNTAPTAGGGQTVFGSVAGATGERYWGQRQNATTTNSGTKVTINDTAPTAIDYSEAIVEVLASSTVAGGPDATSVSTTVNGDGGRSGDSITITGSNFGTVSAGSRASCNGAAGTGCIQFVVGGTDTVPDANITAWSNTSITFTVPSTINSNGGASALQVWAANASDTTPLTFYIYPNISAVVSIGTNAARTYNASDTDGTILLSGDHFGTTTGTSTILGILSTLHNSTSTSCSISGFASTTACFEVPSTITSSTYSGTIILNRASDSKQATTSLSILPRITSTSPTSTYAGQVLQIVGDHFCQPSGTCPVSPNRSTSTTNVSFGGAWALDSDFVNLSGGAGVCNGSGAAWRNGEICVDVPAAAAVSTLSITVTSNNNTSTAATFTVTTPPAPGAPGTPSYTGVSSSTLTVQWSAASGAPNYYTPQRSTSSAFTGSTSLATTTATSTSDSGRSANTTYFYRVSATNAGGTGSNSATSSVLTLPDAPGAPTFSNITTSTLTLTWTTPTGGATFYTPQRSTSSAFTVSTSLATTTATSTNDSGLTQNTTYYYRVSASNATGAGANGSSASTTTSATVNTKPNAPTENAPITGTYDVSTLPTFQVTATDADADNVQYKIVLYTDASCTATSTTYDESSSQSGWSGQNATSNSSNDSYTSGSQGAYTVQVALSAATTYYWKASAIDPLGTNTFGTTGSCKSFTTSFGRWTTDSGSWSISSNKLTVTPASGAYVQLRASSISSQSNGVIEFLGQSSAVGANTGKIAGIVHADSSTNHYYLATGDFLNQQTAIAKSVSSAYTSLTSASLTFSGATLYHFRGYISGSTLSSWVNGVNALTTSDSALASGYIGIGASSTNGTAAFTFDDFAFYSSPTVTLSNLPGGGSWSILDHSGSKITVSGVSCWTGSSVDLSTYTGQVPIDYANGGGQIAVWISSNSCGGTADAKYPSGSPGNIFGGDSYSYSSSGGTVLTGGGTPQATSTITVSTAGSVDY
jgi:hypothetical protein